MTRGATGAPRSWPAPLPTLQVERAILAGGAPFVLGCDEVGRGALAGPVSVGIVLVDNTVSRMPQGLRDSKLLTEPRRDLLAPRARAWVRAWGVGDATAAEIDDVGIMVCLGRAAVRALDGLVAQAVAGGILNRDGLAGAPLLLDGNHDWLSAAAGPAVRVITRIRADRDCASVAAASVIAKVHRAQQMRRAHSDAPQSGSGTSKGYTSAGHRSAIAVHGPHALHRQTWLHPERAEATGSTGAGAAR